MKQKTERLAAVLMGSVVGLALAFAALEVGLRTAALVRSRSSSHSDAAAEAGFREVRLIHGRGKGVQRGRPE